MGRNFMEYNKRSGKKIIAEDRGGNIVHPLSFWERIDIAVKHVIHLLAEEMVLLVWDRAGSWIGGSEGRKTRRFD
jgi:hypothetical protein